MDAFKAAAANPPPAPVAPASYLVEEINKRWPDLYKGVLDSQNMLVQWLFTVPGFGIAGTLTLASTGNRDVFIQLSLFLFVAALISIMVYGAMMYYFNRAILLSYKANVEQLYGNQISVQEFERRETARPMENKKAEWTGWFSGGFSLVAVVSLIVGVLVLK